MVWKLLRSMADSFWNTLSLKGDKVKEIILLYRLNIKKLCFQNPHKEFALLLVTLLQSGVYGKKKYLNILCKDRALKINNLERSLYLQSPTADFCPLNSKSYCL